MAQRLLCAKVSREHFHVRSSPWRSPSTGRPSDKGDSGTLELTESLLGGCHHLDRIPAQHPPTPPCLSPPAGTCQAVSLKVKKKRKKEKKHYQTTVICTMFE